MNERKLQIKQRKLPHWTIEDAVYFVTFTLIKGELSDKEKEIIFDHIMDGHGEFYDLLTFTVMPTHVHIVFNLLGNYDLSRVMKGTKGASSHLLNQSRITNGINWLDESFDRIIRNREELNNTIEYIFINAVKADLVNDGNDYSFYFFNDNWKLEE